MAGTDAKPLPNDAHSPTDAPCQSRMMRSNREPGGLTELLKRWASKRDSGGTIGIHRRGQKVHKSALRGLKPSHDSVRHGSRGGPLRGVV